MQGSRRRMRVSNAYKEQVDGPNHGTVYEYFTSSWLFNQGHFAARLAEEKYHDRLEDRSPHWTSFIKEWLPKYYPGYMLVADSASINPSDESTQNRESGDLQAWYKRTREAVRKKVFTMFPHIATEYYTKRATYVQEKEEQRLRAMITAAIPSGDDGWSDDILKTRLIIKQLDADPSTPELKPTAAGELTPPLTPTDTMLESFSLPSFDLNPERLQPKDPWEIPLYLDPLPRAPPLPCTPRPPPANMSQEAKLLCLARWTLFDTTTGTPYLLSSPRAKDFEMEWTAATYAGATDKVLATWARDMWWHVWIRQSHTNYVGMWKKRFEKEDRREEKKRDKEVERVRAEEMVGREMEKIMRRLVVINKKLGLGEELG
jgi:hypothetical protein